MGKYDIVHLRFFMTIVRDENVDVVMENLKAMLSQSPLPNRFVVVFVEQC